MPPSTLYRFRLELADVDRGVYETLDFRLALHPSESLPYFLARVFAYSLSFEPDSALPLEFNPAGLSDQDEPCLSEASPNGGFRRWVEVGSPSSRKLHKASKAAEQVSVFTHRDPQLIVRDVAANRVHRAEEIEVYALDPKFLDTLSTLVERDNRWSIMRNDGTLSVTVGDRTEGTEIRRTFFANA